MKKLALIVLLALGLSSYGQVDTSKMNVNNYFFGSKFSRLYAWNQFLPPQDTVFSKYGLATKAGVLYVGNGTYWSAVSGTNLYNSNGTLTSNRTVTGGGFDLTFTGGNNLNLAANNKIYFGPYSYYRADSGYWYFVGGIDTTGGGGSPYFNPSTTGGIKTTFYQQVQIIGKDQSTSALLIKGYVSSIPGDTLAYGSGAALAFKRASGTAAAPLNTLPHQSVGYIEFQAYTRRASNDGFNNIAAIAAFARDSITETTRGGDLRFYTTQRGTAGQREGMRIGDNGGITNRRADPRAQIDLRSSDQIDHSGISVQLVPIMLTSGALISTPQDGAIEYNGTDLFYTNSTPNRRTVANLEASQTFSGAKTFSSGITTNQITSSGSTPSASVGAGAGTGATTSITGNDLAGEITLNAGTSPATSADADLVTVTFSSALPSAPRAVILGRGSNFLAWKTTNISTTGFKLQTVGNFSSAASLTHIIPYFVIL